MAPVWTKPPNLTTLQHCPLTRSVNMAFPAGLQSLCLFDADENSYSVLRSLGNLVHLSLDSALYSDAFAPFLVKHFSPFLRTLSVHVHGSEAEYATTLWPFSKPLPSLRRLDLLNFYPEEITLIYDTAPMESPSPESLKLGLVEDASHGGEFVPGQVPHDFIPSAIEYFGFTSNRGLDHLRRAGKPKLWERFPKLKRVEVREAVGDMGYLEGAEEHGIGILMAV